MTKRLTKVSRRRALSKVVGFRCAHELANEGSDDREGGAVLVRQEVGDGVSISAADGWGRVLRRWGLPVVACCTRFVVLVTMELCRTTKRGGS